MEEVVRDLSVLSEPVRIRLMALLEREELGVGELCRVLQLPQSTVSRHLKALQVATWIRRRAEGTSGLFRADPDAVDPVGRQLWQVVREAFVGTHQHAEDAARLAALLEQRAVEDFFGRVGGEWDALRRSLFGDGFLLPAIAALLDEDQAIADLGCGTGPALVELAPVVRKVIGVDREPRMLDAAGARTRELPNVELRRGGLESLPLHDGEVDAALCVLVLHHVADLGRAFEEIRRSLRPGGRLVVVDMVAHDRSDWIQTMGHRHLGFDPDRLRAAGEGAGLRLRSFRHLPPAPEAHGPPLFVASWRR